MKKRELIVGNWYHIEYVNKKQPSRSFTGSAKLMRYNERHDEYAFYSPLSGHEDGLATMTFKRSHIKKPSNPLPTFKELFDNHLRSCLITFLNQVVCKPKRMM